jgi:hypothetical protein
MTVTGVTMPSAAKICVMPIFLPMIPLIIGSISNLKSPNAVQEV